MKTRSWRYFFLWLAAGWLLFTLEGCKQNAREAEVSAATRIEPAPDPALVVVDHPEQFPRVPVSTRKMPDEMSVNGVVAPDVSRTVPVLSMSGGRVVEIHARLGDVVSKGQSLVKIHSNEMTQALSDLKKAQADELLARKALERSQLLYSHGALAQKDLQIAEDLEQKAKVDVETAEDHIRVIGGDLKNLSPILDVKAPVSGTIIEQNVTGGTGVRSLDNSPNLFTIADLSRLWILCDVYEDNLARVKLGDYAEVRLNAYPDRPLKARVSNISAVLDPATRAAKVRLELGNPGGILRPGMFAVVKFTGQSSRERVVLPASALLRLHDKYWVFRFEGDNRFRRTEVKTGPVLPDGFQQVVAGLKSGDEVALNALPMSEVAEGGQAQ
jgi:cobalt-zinc-cadmium efflux system membrane fusion protein